MRRQQKSIGKFLAYVLRHRPDSIGIELDEEGYTDAETLVEKTAERFPGFDMSELEAVVRADSKARYSLVDGKIRANQGHSIEGVLAISEEPQPPPELLYHGTSVTNWKRIQNSGGLERMKRHHVHLSEDYQTARRVGARRREEVIVLLVKAQRMIEDGFQFYRSENGVWLVDAVPMKFLELIEKGSDAR